MTIGRIARAVWHHRLLVSGLTALLVAVVGVITYGEPKSYRASALLQVQAPLSANGSPSLQDTLTARERAVTITSLGNTGEVWRRAAPALRSLSDIHSCSFAQSGQSEFLTATCTGGARLDVARAANAYAAALQNVLEAQRRARIAELTQQYTQQIALLRKEGVPASNFPTQPVFPSYRELDVVDSASTPSGPYAPQPVRTLVIAFVLGLLLNASLAVLLERFQNRARHPEQLQEALGEPVLATIPRLGRNAARDVRLTVAVAPRRARTAGAGAGGKA